MNPKDGKAGKAVCPTAPDEAKEADSADPGEVAKVKAKQRQIKAGKYGSAKVKPFKPPPPPAAAAAVAAAAGATQAKKKPAEEEEPKKAWIEIELVGEDDEPITGEKYEITLPDKSVAKGSLDQKGFARVEGFEPGTCKVSFPDLDQEAWEDA